MSSPGKDDVPEEFADPHPHHPGGRSVPPLRPAANVATNPGGRFVFPKDGPQPQKPVPLATSSKTKSNNYYVFPKDGPQPQKPVPVATSSKTKSDPYYVMREGPVPMNAKEDNNVPRIPAGPPADEDEM